jgi:ATP/maltotriose-dependent transcriptional regulator MalT
MDRESRPAADTSGLLLNRLEISAPSERRLGSAIERGALTVSPRLRVAERKLMLPRVHPRALRRARLLEMLDHLDGAALTVLNAGVGYGKTTLLRSWCTERPEPVAWITLDTGDDDPVRLWTHLATAVDRLGPGLGDPALTLLGRGAQVEIAVDELMNALMAYDCPASIVLDDLDSVRSDASLRSIEHAIHRLPANVRLLTATRSDPAISVARLRASRSLLEIRASDLAFTVDETRELLVHEGIALSGDGLELLAERTEGWPAGLYLAALWLRDLEDPDEGVRALARNARHVGDYLTDEVLTKLDASTRDFLLRTAVLDRFTPEMCDAVLGRSDAAAVLADLVRSNMFLVSLDAGGEWYRYHHLFGELLRLDVAREDASELRLRAMAWCRARGRVEDALEYAAAAGDAENVAELLVEHGQELVWGGRIGQFLRWLRWLPPELLMQHPSLPAAGAVAASLLAAPELEVERLLAVADRARRERPELWSPYAEAVVEVSRANGLARGDVTAAVEHARRAVAAAAAGADVLTVAVLAALSQALFFAGDLDRARRVALQAAERPDAPEVLDGYVASLGLLALIDAEQGRIESAQAWARQAISFARERFRADSWIASLAHLGLAQACRAAGRLDEAEREAMHGERLRRSPQPTVGHAHALLVLAQTRVACSRMARAAGDLERAQRSIAGFADPGRLPTIAAGIEQDLAIARAAETSPLVEEPSPAQLAVLQCLAAGGSRREIGERLYISLNTVKTHTRELYRKLGARSGADAVARAEALGLLERANPAG